MLRAQYRDYLIERGYKEVTPSGHPSTVYDYVKRIDFVCDYEGVTWVQLAERIDEVEQQYEPGGPKDYLGAKSHGAVVNALRRFREFCYSNKVEQETSVIEDSAHESALDKDAPFDISAFFESGSEELKPGRNSDIIVAVVITCIATVITVPFAVLIVLSFLRGVL